MTRLVVTAAAVYVLFFYNDGALFAQLTDALGAWVADRLMDNLPR